MLGVSCRRQVPKEGVLFTYNKVFIFYCHYHHLFNSFVYRCSVISSGSNPIRECVKTLILLSYSLSFFASIQNVP